METDLIEDQTINWKFILKKWKSIVRVIARRKLNVNIHAQTPLALGMFAPFFRNSFSLSMFSLTAR